MKELSVILFSSFKFAMTFPLAILEYKMGIIKTILLTNIGGLLGIIFFSYLSDLVIQIWKKYVAPSFRKLFSMNKPFFKKNPKWMQYMDLEGYSLENALEHLIGENRKDVVEGLNLHSREKGSGAYSTSIIGKGIHAADKLDERRRKTARVFEYLRRRKQEGHRSIEDKSGRKLLDLAKKMGSRPVNKLSQRFRLDPEDIREELKKIEEERNQRLRKMREK